jgi:hypothetical protein
MDMQIIIKEYNMPKVLVHRSRTYKQGPAALNLCRKGIETENGAAKSLKVKHQIL